MYRLFRFRSQIKNGFPQIVLIDKPHLLKTANFSNIPGKINVINILLYVIIIVLML